MIGVSAQGDQEGAPLNSNRDVYAPQQGERGRKRKSKWCFCAIVRLLTLEWHIELPYSLSLSIAFSCSLDYVAHAAQQAREWEHTR